MGPQTPRPDQSSHRPPGPKLDLRNTEPPELSVVMPCLNEHDSVGVCVAKAWRGIEASGLTGEVIVADNGSTDGSIEVAEAAGARVVHQPRRGYGNAYLKGFESSRGQIIVMGDSDDSYDFTGIPALVQPVRDGTHDYVLGSRFGGTMEPGAMSWSHRYVGNPVLTSVLNVLFDLNVSDAHSGLRAFSRPALERMNLRCEGMEFASEIVVKAARAELRVAEIPIVYHPRIGHSKLNPLRDTWRHLRFLLTLSPLLMSVLPGLLLLVAGVVALLGLGFVGPGTGALEAKAGAGFAVVVGGVLVAGGLFAGVYAYRAGFERSSRFWRTLERGFRMERGLIAGALMAAVGVALVIRESVNGWEKAVTDSASATSAVVGIALLLLGIQVAVASFAINIFHELRLERLRQNQVQDEEPTEVVDLGTVDITTAATEVP